MIAICAAIAAYNCHWIRPISPRDQTYHYGYHRALIVHRLFEDKRIIVINLSENICLSMPRSSATKNEQEKTRYSTQAEKIVRA